MIISLFAILVCVLSIIITFDSNIVSHYENLILSEQQRASTNILPTDNKKFKLNVETKFTDFGVYDYIVIGAGSAGCVIASRLTEHGNTSVLLVEAGGEESDFSDIPLMNVYLQGLQYNWNYNTTTQTTSCLGLINHQCAVPRGKGLGGSSIINAVTYTRGNRRDYDDWKNQGNVGWGFDELLPLFKNTEDFKPLGDEKYRGSGGYVVVDEVNSSHIQVNAFIEANRELGRLEIDYNGKQQIGVGKSQVNVINGKRQSVAKAFLNPAKNRINLTIRSGSLVTKILIKTPKNEAYGVLFSHNGKSYRAVCRKEVIVSAGTINSPQLLMLSGIGPKSHLKKMDIPIIKDLPVGLNLQDHVAYYDLIFETNYTEPKIELRDHIVNYLNGFGRLTVGGNSHAIAFLQINSSLSPGQPNIEFLITPSDISNSFVKKSNRYTDETFHAIWSNVKSANSFSIIVVLLHPESRGVVKLKSSSPYDYPLIDLQMLSDQKGKDIKTMYEGVQLALQLLETNAFKQLNASLVNNALPACRNYLYLSKEYWYCQLRQIAMTIYHPVGTCKMGPNSDKNSVVNSKLQVHGVRNLRVADASIMPLIVSGHTNAAAIMIGEKLSELILNDI